MVKEKVNVSVDNKDNSNNLVNNDREKDKFILSNLSCTSITSKFSDSFEFKCRSIEKVQQSEENKNYFDSMK